MSEPGHNSAPATVVSEYVRRLTTLEEDKRATQDEIRELKEEAKEGGLDPRALAAIVKRNLETPDQKERRQEFESTLDTYLQAMGLIG